MDTNGKKIDWHFNVLPSHTKKALDFLSNEKWMKSSNLYLAGGTALALQVGNRKSFDLDFFSMKKFNEKKILENFLNNSDWLTEVEDRGTIYGKLLNSKISFIYYPFFIPVQDFVKYGAINMLNPIDIAVMKITALSQRGRKRDFFDLYWCAKNLEPLEEIIKKLPKQYPTVAHDYHHLLKSMVYFEDAESDPEPEIFFKASWKEVKKFFEKEIPIIAKKLILK
jgi:hypothetical protein